MTTSDDVSLIRRALLALLVIGCVGTIAELLLLEHYDETGQLIPFVVLGLTLVVIVWHWLEGRRTSLRALQAVMLVMVVTGALGAFLHLRDNYGHVVRDADPALTGLAFWMEVLRGDAPSLAPGMMLQFGLLGLLYAYKHPALGASKE